MALKATIYKANINIANMDDHIYGDTSLTMARHPSETEERLMVRLLAYCRFTDANAEGLEFTKDLFETGEPALWQHDLTGMLTQWIEVGLPDEDKVRKARARCPRVAVVAYGSTAYEWYQKSSKHNSLSNVSVWALSSASTEAVQALCSRGMDLQLNIMDGEWTLISDDAQAIIEWEQWQ